MGSGRDKEERQTEVEARMSGGVEVISLLRK
jgi:hypothetical protein